MAFDLKKLKSLRRQTPFFVFDREILLKNYNTYVNCMPKGTEICYAMKSNSEKCVLEVLNRAGASFEVASRYELLLLKNLGVPANNVIYGTSVKPEDHIKEFVRYGVDRFAFDSEEELIKIARLAPKSRVYVRVLVDDKSNSVFHMSEKFGTSINNSINLLIKAKKLGLIPYGISFNVGSQARNPEAWALGIKDIAKTMTKLLKHGIKIQAINIGGGFPHDYSENGSFPKIEKITKHISEALPTLPYKVDFIAEPGRGLVVDAFVLITSVIGMNKRMDGEWLFIDAGVYNALLEAMTCQGTTRYLIEPFKLKRISLNRAEYVLTGPTGDNIDVIDEKALLPDSIQTGDQLIIHDVGAYTFTLMTPFNGFPKPKIVIL